MNCALFSAIISINVFTTFASQCKPFQADVYLAFDELDGTHIPGDPLNSTADAGVALLPNTQIGMGNAAEVDGAKIQVLEDSDHACFFDPMADCADGFTLSVLVATYSGQAGTDQVYISSGADATNSWGFALVVSDSSILAKLKLLESTTLYTASAQDDTYTYDDSQDSEFMHLMVTWNATSEVLSLYRDGVLKDENARTSQTTFLSRTFDEFFIGQANSGQSYGRGLVDELVYFYHTETPAFVSGLYSNYQSDTLCKSSCVHVADGDYQSCLGCNMYVECAADTLTQHVCPSGYSWSITSATCVLHSGTCDPRVMMETQTEPCIPNECDNNACENGATCLYLTDGFNCTCAPGFEGGHCEVDIDECESSPCVHGACVDQVNMYECNCTAGYYQTLCDEYDGCYGDPCLNDPTACDDVINGTEDTSFVCTCSPGFTGSTCETDIDECASDPCVNNGTCIDLINGYNCTCPGPYVEAHCEGYDECYDDPCLNGATCAENSTAVTSDYTCHCAHGFSGMHCEDEDECITESVDCQNGGTCLDLEGAWNCSCVPGYTGVNCETDIDECASNPCVHGNCTDQVNMYACACEDPYHGTNCDDINSCIDDPCVNGECTDYDDVTGMTYNCTCDHGFSDVNCTTENECLTQEVTCLNDGVCEDLEGNYTCVNCTPGFVGQLCGINVDECASDPCQQGGTCSDQVNGYTCTCPNTYIGDDCEEFDNCHSDPCENGGECEDLTDEYECDCSDTGGYYGTDCSLEDECVTQGVDCQNGGTCSDPTDDTWSCTCTTGYWGTNCEYEDLCEMLSPCENGATCSREVDGYECACAEGYSGDDCSFAMECVLQEVECENGGTCVNEIDDWSCTCPETHFGSRCGRDNPCYGGDCDAVGTQECEPESSSRYTCHCYDDFSGDLCDTGPCNDTDSPPCDNNGTRECIHDSEGSVTCECLATYSGDTCATLRALTTVEGEYRITDLDFTDDFNDPSSSAYAALETEIVEGLSDICECTAEVSGFSAGSVIVAFVLHVAVNPDVDALELAIQTAAEEGWLLDGHTVSNDSVSLSSGSGVVDSGGSTNDDDDDKGSGKFRVGFIVVMVVFILVLLLVLIAAIYVIKSHKKKKEQIYPDDHDKRPILADNNTSSTTSFDGAENKSNDDVTLPPPSESRPLSGTSRPSTTKKTRPLTAMSRQSTAWVENDGQKGDGEEEEGDGERGEELKASEEAAAATFDSGLVFRGQVLPSLPDVDKRGLSGPVVDADDHNTSQA